jgi:SAM-dependent methyltransferase
VVREDPFFLRFFPECTVDTLEGYHEALQAHVPERGRLLDLGCGDNTGLARYRTPGREVWGADLQPHPGLQHPRWFRQLGAYGDIPFGDETFDLVSACWVLEHIAAPTRFLREVNRVLRPGGWFVALTPNGRHYATWLIRLLDCLPHRLTQEIVYRLYQRRHYDTFPTYYRLNTGAELAAASRQVGLRLAGIRGFPNPDYFAFSALAQRAAVLADWLLDRLNPDLGRLYLVASLHKPSRSQPEPASSTANSERSAA